MKMTKFLRRDLWKGMPCGTMWVKETNPYWKYYKQNLKTLKEIEV